MLIATNADPIQHRNLRNEGSKMQSRRVPECPRYAIYCGYEHVRPVKTFGIVMTARRRDSWSVFSCVLFRNTNGFASFSGSLLACFYEEPLSWDA